MWLPLVYAEDFVAVYFILGSVFVELHCQEGGMAFKVVDHRGACVDVRLERRSGVLLIEKTSLSVASLRREYALLSTSTVVSIDSSYHRISWSSLLSIFHQYFKIVQ